MSENGIVRSTVNDGRSIRVYFVDNAIPVNFPEIFSNYGIAHVDSVIAPYVVVECKSKLLARQCEQYARKLDNWDTCECINWAQNDEPLYTECIRIARKFQDRPARAQLGIRNAIVASGILHGTGVRVRFVDWRGVAAVFVEE